MNEYKLMLVDDHPLIVEGLTNMVKQTDNIKIVATTANGADALMIIKRTNLPIDLVIFDYRMPTMLGDEFLKKLNAINFLGRTLLLTTFEDQVIFEKMWGSGLDGILLKTASVTEIINTAKFLIDNPSNKVWYQDTVGHNKDIQNPLTIKEQTVLSKIAQGEHVKEISEELRLSEWTIKYHLTDIYNKLGTSNRAQAVAISISERWISL